MMELYNTIIMTRKPAPDSRPVVLTIAGSDSGGGAGIQADLKTIEAGGAFGTSAITAVTAQNTLGVVSSHVLPIEEIDAQIDAVLSDFDVRAVKTGMLATAPVIAVVTEYVDDLDVPVVVDPVMVAATGDRLLAPDAENVYEDLLAHAALTTPNADEAEVLTGIELTDHEGTIQAGKALLETGVDAALSSRVGTSLLTESEMYSLRQTMSKHTNTRESILTRPMARGVRSRAQSRPASRTTNRSPTLSMPASRSSNGPFATTSMWAKGLGRSIIWWHYASVQPASAPKKTLKASSGSSSRATCHGLYPRWG